MKLLESTIKQIVPQDADALALARARASASWGTIFLIVNSSKFIRFFLL